MELFGTIVPLTFTGATLHKYMVLEITFVTLTVVLEPEQIVLGLAEMAAAGVRLTV